MIGIELALPLALAPWASSTVVSNPVPLPAAQVSYTADDCPPAAGPAAYRTSYVPAATPSYARNYVPQVTVPAPPAPSHRVHSPPVMTAGILFGGRSLDDPAYSPLDDHGMFGFDFAATNLGSGPLGIEFGTQFSTDESGVVDLYMSELYLGGRLTLGDLADSSRPVVPYVSAGGTLVNIDIEQANLSSNEQETGWYFTAGLDFLVTPEFSVGVQYRKTGGLDSDFGFAGLGGVDTDLDYDQVAIRLGFYF